MIWCGVCPKDIRRTKSYLLSKAAQAPYALDVTKNECAHDPLTQITHQIFQAACYNASSGRIVARSRGEKPQN